MITARKMLTKGGNSNLLERHGGGGDDGDGGDGDGGGGFACKIRLWLSKISERDEEFEGRLES